MNIAILIGISKYKSEAPLPACAHDAENMRRLLASTRKYDEIHVVQDHTNASQVKDALRQFFARHQAAGAVDEALIYFSGHGTYQNDALLCCADFDANRPASTSISNSELDDLLRSVKPTVAVKIIDACQSGSPYIKDANAGFEKALSRSSLNSFICMASSRQDQSSFASATDSAFTSHWITAALEKDDGVVLYRDIQAALADAFVATPDQTPFFVSQGTGLEQFSSVTEEMKALRTTRSKSTTPGQVEADVSHLIRSEISKLDKAFVPHEIVKGAINASKDALANTGIADSIVKQFYVKSVKTDLKLTSIPKARAVAKFAEEQSWPKRYFVRVNEEAYKTRVPKDALAYLTSSSKRLFGKMTDEDFVTETRYRPSTLESTESLPFELAELSLSSTHPSLPVFLVYIGIVHSLTEVMVLSATVRLIQSGWDSRSPELSDVAWRYQSYPWASVVEQPAVLWRDAQDRGEQDVRSFLEALPPKPEQSAIEANPEVAPPSDA